MFWNSQLKLRGQRAKERLLLRQLPDRFNNSAAELGETAPSFPLGPDNYKSRPELHVVLFWPSGSSG